MLGQFFVHLMSLIGTLAKSRAALNLSAFGGRPEVIDTQSEWRDCAQRTFNNADA